MESTSNIALTSVEIASLWTTYMNDSMSLCVIENFLNTVQDQDVQKPLRNAYDYSRKHIDKISAVFDQEGVPIPKAFGKEDHNPGAPRLFTDPFYLYFIAKMSVIGLNAYSLSLTHSARTDIRNFYSECLTETIDLFNKTIDIMLNKGIFVRAPIIETSKQVSFIEDLSFFAGILKEEPRSLLTVEITGIYANLLSNMIGIPLITGFAQVSESFEVKQYMLKGKEIAANHVRFFGSLLQKDDIPVPSLSNSFVTDSTEFTFSEKLMMFIVSALVVSSLPSYATGMANSLRHDLQLDYVRLSAEIAKYASDGSKIMIDNRWMEQPPQAIRHENLVKV